MTSFAAELLSRGTTALADSGGRAMAPRIHAVWAGAMVAGPALTVHCEPGDNLAIHVAVASAPAGSVLVVDASSEPDHGYFGEVLTTAAQARGLAGLVIDGGVRDSLALERLRFPVFATGVAITAATKVRGGSSGEPVDVGDVRVNAGDWVVADADGVTVVAAADLDRVQADATERLERERTTLARLRAGETTVTVLELDPSRVSRATPLTAGDARRGAMPR
jgi:4-hydroxy-4-methyl-2-oxoglutarate aldolase